MVEVVPELRIGEGDSGAELVLLEPERLNGLGSLGRRNGVTGLRNSGLDGWIIDGLVDSLVHLKYEQTRVNANTYRRAALPSLRTRVQSPVEHVCANGALRLLPRRRGVWLADRTSMEVKRRILERTSRLIGRSKSFSVSTLVPESSEPLTRMVSSRD